MLITTLGYIQKDHSYLMMHRIKKENDLNHDKWIGVGGKLEKGETILQCMKRETFEETGLIWKDPLLRGIVTFNFKKRKEDPLFCEQMFLFTGKEFSGEPKECNEGTLEWVNFDQIPSLPLWKGDLIFLDLLKQDIPLFYLKLDYLKDDLVYAELDGIPLEI